MTPDRDFAARLRDLQAPAEPSWWPPAPGWWLVALAAVALAAIAIRALLPWRRWRTRQRLLISLEAVARRHRAGAPATAAAESRLRRGSSPGPRRRRVRSDWIAFLDPATARQGASGAARCAHGAPDASGALGRGPLLAAARGWLRAAL
jgi:hypothetical protein